MAVFVASLLTMAISRIFHSHFSILSNCLPWNMWQPFIVWATTSSPTGWNADLKGNNQEWQGVMLETGWRTANYNEEHREKWKWWYRNDEHIKAMHISNKKSWDGKYNVRWLFFLQVHPSHTSFRLTQSTWILFRAEGTSRLSIDQQPIIFQWGIQIFLQWYRFPDNMLCWLAWVFSWMSYFPGLV